MSVLCWLSARYADCATRTTLRSLGPPGRPRSPNLASMFAALMAVAVIIAGTGFVLIISSVNNERKNRRRPDLTERLQACRSSVADAAGVWHRRQ